MTRAGLRRFLMLAAAVEIAPDDIPLWELIWAMNHYVNERARTLGVRIPYRYSTHDRTVVRFMMLRDLRGEAVLRAKARKWAHN